MKFHAKSTRSAQRVDLTKIRSLTDFQRNARRAIREMKKTGQPQVLTVNGKAELIVQDAASYQRMLDELDRTATVAALRRGLADAAAGRTMPVEKALERIRRKHGISD